MDPDILFEDNHVLAVNKPAGLLTQGGLKGQPSLLDNLKHFIKIRDNKPGNVFLGMVHRLDKPVSGVIVFAKTSKGASRLSERIRTRRVLKLYCAVTAGAGREPAPVDTWLTYRHYLLRQHDTSVIVKEGDSRAREAVLRLRTLFSNGRNSFHLVHLVSGRKHQIRSQLAHLGLPVTGDRKYGSKEECPGGIGLHALFFQTRHPVGEKDLTLMSLPPPRMYDCFTERERVSIESRLGGECLRFTEEPGNKWV